MATYSDSIKNLNVSYKYNEDGIRISKTVNNVETKYYLENSNIIYQQTGNDIIYFIYDTSGIAGFEYLGNTYYYVKNLQGDIIEILDSSYQTIAKYNYNAWGEIISITDNQNNDVSSNASHIANINPFRYRSYYYDQETGLYYLNSRYYNAEWGRFINSDSIGGANGDILSYNLYAYCSNNPIMYIDPSGYGIISWFKKQLNKLLGINSNGSGSGGNFSSRSNSSGGGGGGGGKLPDDIKYTRNEIIVLPGQGISPELIKGLGKLVVHIVGTTLTTALAKNILDSVEPKKEPPCTTASIVGGAVVRGNYRFDIGQAINNVVIGTNVFCDNMVTAQQVASGASIIVTGADNSYLDPPHGGAGFYPHYHPGNYKNHPHIWFNQ